MSDGNFIGHEACTECGSSDGVGVWDNDTRHCFACNHHWYGPTNDRDNSVVRQHQVGRPKMEGTVAAIVDRRISQATCQKFGVQVEFKSDGSIFSHLYPYYSTGTNELLGVKKRLTDTKDFYYTGDNKNVGLFGQNKCSGRGKFVTLCEGEVDALSISEMFDRKWDVVSVRTGASGARKEVQSQLEWLEGYDQIVLCFDNDKAGKAAIDSIKDLFAPNKVKVVQFPEGFKDANDMLVAGKVQDFVKCWWDAKAYRPDGIVAGTEMWDRLCRSNNIKSVLYPWDGLNHLTKGFRRGELVTVTSGSGMGKSSFTRELEYYCLNATQGNIGVLALEESVERTIKGIMSMEAGYPMHLDENLTPEDMKPYYDKVMGTGRFYFFDHFGSTGEDNILSRVRFMAKALDCETIFLDHLSIVVSAQETGDERKAIDSIMTKLRTLVQELNIALFLVSHLRRSAGKAHEDGGQISLSELRGSQAIAQLSDMVIGMERNQQHEDEEVRNTTTVRVLKNRYSGLTGPACYLRYDPESGRMIEVAKPQDVEDEF